MFLPLLRYKLYYSHYANFTQAEDNIKEFPIILHSEDMVIRLIKSTTKSTKENNYRLIVDYVDVLKEIFDESKNKKSP